MEKKKEGGWAFQKAAGLNRRGLKQKTKLGGRSKSSALAGGMRGRAVLFHWPWLGCWWEEPGCGKGGGNPGAMVVGSEEQRMQIRGGGRK